MAVWKVLLAVALLGQACHCCMNLLDGCKQSHDLSHPLIFCQSQDRIIECLRRVGCKPVYEENREVLIVEAKKAKYDRGCPNHGTQQGAGTGLLLTSVIVAMATRMFN